MWVEAQRRERRFRRTKERESESKTGPPPVVTAPATSIGDVAPPKETRAKSEKAANDMMAVNGEPRQRSGRSGR